MPTSSPRTFSRTKAKLKKISDLFDTGLPSIYPALLGSKQTPETHPLSTVFVLKIQYEGLKIYFFLLSLRFAEAPGWHHQLSLRLLVFG